MDKILTQCPYCGVVIESLNRSYIGKDVVCECGKSFTVIEMKDEHVVFKKVNKFVQVIFGVAAAIIGFLGFGITLIASQQHTLNIGHLFIGTNLLLFAILLAITRFAWHAQK